MGFKEDALSILNAALEAANGRIAVRTHFEMPQEKFERVVLVSVGKAACSMALGVEDVTGPRLDGALVITKHGHAENARQAWQVFETGHPVPDEAGERAAHAVRDLAQGLGERDLLILAVSGGASALLPAPLGPVTLSDKRQATELLLRAGANIHELNAVRKHLSFLKGGRLAQIAFPATVVSLLLSDVIGDDLDVIGSGLTAPDPSTRGDARAVLEKFELWDPMPESVKVCLRSGPETPKQNDPVFDRVRNVIAGNNRLALEAAAQHAQFLGYETHILSDRVQGEARVAAIEHAALLKFADAPACLLSGGETTVTIRGNGRGGRNQEFALTLACEIDQRQGLAALCAGTDGTDGPTDAAGAFVDDTTVRRAQSRGLNPADSLHDNDSYPFFESLGDLVKTGPTGTNVMDINIMLARKS